MAAEPVKKRSKTDSSPAADESETPTESTSPDATESTPESVTTAEASASSPAAGPAVDEAAPASEPASSDAPVVDEAPRAVVYRVAVGRSLTTRRGLKDAGSVLDPEKDVHGGVERLEQLVAAGAVSRT